MDILGILMITILVTWWTQTTLFPKPPKEKSAEEKLGEAIGSVLKTGIKINIVHSQDKGKP
ncbi:MAG: hypothetical protein EA367_07685 [Leptolyngbya sp. DLM2.Bin15]|nr:MAG: hypothetical protein EA367_07685 [Leptolyngbya sp. DLM2.Bin15]